MTLDVQVPTKIVIMGTSSMSLNDRFSKIKKVVVPAAKQQVRMSRKGLTAAPRQSRSTLALDEDDYEDGLMEEEVIEEEVYDPTYAAVRRTRNPVIARPRVATIYRNHVPLQDRISFSPQPYRVTPYNNGFAANRGRAGFRSNYGINRAQNGFRYNPNYGRLNAGFQPRFQNNKNGGFPPRYGRGGARGGFVKKQQPKKSQEELDRELDEYMTKPHHANSKHVPITMDGLE